MSRICLSSLNNLKKLFKQKKIQKKNCPHFQRQLWWSSTKNVENNIKWYFRGAKHRQIWQRRVSDV